jgi:mono/diheme cytochrome c family protein
MTFRLSLLRAGLTSATLVAFAPPVAIIGQEALGPDAMAGGAELVSELGCGACHVGLPAPDPARSRAPRLGGLEMPLPGLFVYEYLDDPQPRLENLGATRMPDFRLSDRERWALALAIGEDTEGLDELRGRFPEVSADHGDLLFAALGCSGCHGALGSGEGTPATDAPAAEVAPDLGNAGSQYREEWLRAFLDDPAPVRPAGYAPGSGSRMPDFRLAPDEVERVVGYLQGLTDEPERSGRTAPATEPPHLSRWGRARAEAYLTDRLSCLGCHSWRGDGGRVAPPLDGLADRLQADEVVRMVRDPGATRPGTVMPASTFAPRILDQVAALLVEDSAPWTPVEAPALDWGERMSLLRGRMEESGSPPQGTLATPTADPPDTGRATYLQRCAQCHGVQGNGAGFNAPFLPVPPTPHADSATMARRPDDTVYDGIAAGGWVLDRSHRMPAFGRSLTRAQIRATVAYIRELCGCSPPGWSVTGGGR